MKLHLEQGGWWLILLTGVGMTLAGLFGVWLQGPFYNGGFPTAATFDEIHVAFTWPTAFTACGGMLLTTVILVSPFTRAWNQRGRFVVLAVFVFLLLLACHIAGLLATRWVEDMLT